MKKKPKNEAKKIARLFDELMQAPLIPFPASRQRLEAPKERGVYVIYEPNGQASHVGCTPWARNGIHQRLTQHLAARSSYVGDYLNNDGSKLRNGFKFRCIVVEDPRERAILEAYTIGHLCPSHIGHGLD